MSGRLDEFDDRDCRVLGVSTDTIETHMRWLATPPAENGLGPISFPLASDSEGSISEKYSVYDQKRGMALRGLFLIDPNGVLQYQVTHNLNVGRSTDEILRVLDAIQSGGLCPADKTSKESLNLSELAGPNRVIGDYEIESELGSGAFGTVFLAQDKVLKRQVALKVLKAENKDRVASLIAEARAAATLNHPNVCTVHAIDQSSGGSMIVMEYVEGETLMDRMSRGKLDEHLTAQIAFQISDAMAAAHQAGVVHGDLKPANVMLTPANRVKVMDFGLARTSSQTNFDMDTIDRNWASIDTSRIGQESFALSAGLSGTPRYMSPELTQGKATTASSDVFALGLMVYEMATGKPAVHGGNLLDIIRCIDSIDGQKLASELTGPLEQVIRETLVNNIDDRTVTMDQIAQLLSGISA